MGNVRMQSMVTRYCNSDLVGPDGKPVNCHLSNSMETMGLILPGMDDGKSLTTRQDILVTKDGQLTVEASPGRPYEFIVTAHTTKGSHMIQLYNKTSFPIRPASEEESPKQEQLKSLNHELTLEDHGWIQHGLVHVDGEKLHKRVLDKLNGTDPKTGMNYTALALTGLIPNSWTLYTDENDTRIVKLLATNNLHNDKVFQETVVTHWEELHENMTVKDTLQLVYSSYEIEKHSTSVPSRRRDPVPEAMFLDSELTGEMTREFFENTRNPDWLPPRPLRGSTGSARRIDYFRIIPGTASYKYFHAKASYPVNGLTKFDFPKDCTTSFITSKSPFCLHVNFELNKTMLVLDFFMGFQDFNQRHKNAHLNISVYYSDKGSVLNFMFKADGCAVIWQAGVSFANLNIAVCIAGSGDGKSLLQPDKATYRGTASISVSLNLDVPIVPTISVSIEGGLATQGAPHNNITASAYLKLSRSLLIVGADMWVEVIGHTLNHKINTWEFETFFNLQVWAGFWIFKHHWKWTWSLFKVGPVTF
ncbi:hypothetical protein FOL47_006052 [Perkinsus chesapeaki]|uniref:Uncharacterized protein n=1 Tax=Perkinsus chesapeaki TaxID=330153 RepID=A0A7J6LU32_PERCH|nr:hypothetical protein FOL47_006052 [Perkinsus chesapeaki]